MMMTTPSKFLLEYYRIFSIITVQSTSIRTIVHEYSKIPLLFVILSVTKMLIPQHLLAGITFSGHPVAEHMRSQFTGDLRPVPVDCNGRIKSSLACSRRGHYESLETTAAWIGIA